MGSQFSRPTTDNGVTSSVPSRNNYRNNQNNNNNDNDNAFVAPPPPRLHRRRHRRHRHRSHEHATNTTTNRHNGSNDPDNDSMMIDDSCNGSSSHLLQSHRRKQPPSSKTGYSPPMKKRGGLNRNNSDGNNNNNSNNENDSDYEVNERLRKLYEEIDEIIEDKSVETALQQATNTADSNSCALRRVAEGVRKLSEENDTLTEDESLQKLSQQAEEKINKRNNCYSHNNHSSSNDTGVDGGGGCDDGSYTDIINSNSDNFRSESNSSSTTSNSNSNNIISGVESVEFMHVNTTPTTQPFRDPPKATNDEAGTDTTNEKTFHSIEADGQLKFQSQARDSSDPVVSKISTDSSMLKSGVRTSPNNEYPDTNVNSNVNSIVNSHSNSNSSTTMMWNMRDGDLMFDRLKKMKVTELRAELSKRGLSADGLKAELVLRYDITLMMEGVLSNDRGDQTKCTMKLSRLLGIEKNQLKQDVIDAGVVPRFVKFLQEDCNSVLQFGAALALTNIAAGTSDHTKVVVKVGAVPIFVRLLLSPNDVIREQAVQALGNIAVSPPWRDLVLQAEAMPPLLRQLHHNCKLGMLRSATLALSNFCRGSPPPNFEMVRPSLPTLLRLINNQDEFVVYHACWALAYLSSGPNNQIQAVIEAAIEADAYTRLVGFLSNDNNALPYLLNLLSSSTKDIKKKACMIISNIAAGNEEQIQAVIDNNIIPPLIQLLTNTELDIREEAALVISKATSHPCTFEHVEYFVRQGCIPPLCDLLIALNPLNKTVAIALEGLENIFKVGEEQSKKTGEVNAITTKGMQSLNEYLETIKLRKQTEQERAAERAGQGAINADDSSTVVVATGTVQRQPEGLVDLELADEHTTAASERTASFLRGFNRKEEAIIHEAIWGDGPSTDIVAESGTDTVQRSSMHTLQPGMWLTDEIVHYFYLMLETRDAELCSSTTNTDPDTMNTTQKKLRSHFFKSFFITKLLNEGSATKDGEYEYDNVKSWSQKVPGEDIFALDKIFFPINIGNMHWSSAVIFMQKKRIEIFDSMGSNGWRYLDALFQYLQDEHLDKKKSPLPDMEEWKLVPTHHETPEQHNGYDCGVFTCFFADFVSMDLPLTFDQSHIDQLRERVALSIMKGIAIE